MAEPPVKFTRPSMLRYSMPRSALTSVPLAALMIAGFSTAALAHPGHGRWIGGGPCASADRPRSHAGDGGGRSLGSTTRAACNLAATDSVSADDGSRCGACRIWGRGAVGRDRHSPFGGYAGRRGGVRVQSAARRQRGAGRTVRGVPRLCAWQRNARFGFAAALWPWLHRGDAGAARHRNRARQLRAAFR